MAEKEEQQEKGHSSNTYKHGSCFSIFPGHLFYLVNTINFILQQTPSFLHSGFSLRLSGYSKMDKKVLMLEFYVQQTDTIKEGQNAHVKSLYRLQEIYSVKRSYMYNIFNAS